MKHARTRAGNAARLFCAGALAICLAPSRGDAAAAPSTKKKAAVSVSGSQLYQRLDSIDKQVQKLLEMQKELPAPAAPKVEPAAGDLTRAFYNYGVYKKQAAQLRATAHLIRGITVLGGVAAAIVGWEKGRDRIGSLDKDAGKYPRTVHNSFSKYPYFSYGVSTAVLGVAIGYVVDLVSFGADRKAAQALMEPVVAGAAGGQ